MLPKYWVPSLSLMVVGVSAILCQNKEEAPKKRELPKTLLTPADSVKLALADIQATPDKDLRKFVRYLSIYNIHPEDRDAYIKILSFVLNSLNGGRSGNLKRLIVMPGIVAGSEKSVLRIQLDAYSIRAEDWDTLGQKGSGPVRSVKKLDQPEPYFHTLTKEPKKKGTKKLVQRTDEQGRKLFYGGDKSKPVMDEKEVEEDEKELLHAPWLPAQDIATLALETQTDFPILRGDWFLANATLAPAYYDFLGIKTLKDVQDIGRFRGRDEDLAEKGVVNDSGEVALHNRALRRTPTSLGYWWESFDYLTSLNDDDLLTNLLNKKRDASEIIFTLPNTLQGYALINGQDQIIDFADPNVASDTLTPWKNKLVWSAASCMYCHNQGMKDITDEVRLLSKPTIGLLVKKKKDFEEVVQLFSTPIDEILQKDKEVYRKAIGLATGLTPDVNASTFQRFFINYLQKPLLLEEIALEVGQQPEAITKVIEKTIGPDHTLTQALSKRPVRRDQWEAKGFAQLMFLTYPPKK